MTETKAAVTLPVDVEQIQRLLPHRYPFLLVDRVIEIDPGKAIATSADAFVIVRPGARLEASGSQAQLDVPGLGRVLLAGDGGRIPNPALVQVSQRLPSDTVANIKKAMTGFNTTGVLDGWRSSGGVGDVYRTLRQRLSEGPLPLRKALDYSLQIARGIAAAHDKNIVHRGLRLPSRGAV